VESISRSERVKRTWQNPDRRAKQTRALKECWQREDYRTRLTNHLRSIASKGARRAAELRSSGGMKFTDESRKHWSEGQRRRFQRPEERRKLEKARELSFRALSQEARAKLMRKAFLAIYGSYIELTKMALRSPKRKPNQLELEVAKLLGEEWGYVGDGRLEIGGLIPDFVHKTKRKVLEVLGRLLSLMPCAFS
jgi:hypothetical protein